MDHKTFVVLFLGILATASCQQLPLYETAAEEEPLDKQLAAIGALAYNLIQPAFSNILAALTVNLGSAIQNAFSAFMAGKQLELITMESLEPFKESAATAAPTAHLAIHPNVVGGEPSKRRPYTRTFKPDEPLRHSEPKTDSL